MDADDVETPNQPALAVLNARQKVLLSQVAQDIRATVSHLSLPKVSALSVLTPEAMDNLKDLYYMLNTEDPLNAMPVRQHVLLSQIPTDCLLPMTVAAHKDPASSRNRKRWALPTYQTLRLLSVLTLPVAAHSELPTPCPLDYYLSDLRTALATHPASLNAFVALLQYYIDKKAEKKAAMLPAEEAKLEDARIDNILRFFSNILSPPRPDVPKSISDQDRPIHLALIGSLLSADFFATLSVLFCTPEDARSQYTDLVFLVSEIYGQTYRHSTPLQIFLSSLQPEDGQNGTKPIPKIENGKPDERTKDPTRSVPLRKPVLKATRQSSSALRNALARDRTLGSSRAVTASARWSNRHSGSITAAPTKSASQTGSYAAAAGKRIVSTRRAVHENKGFNPLHDFQEGLSVNAELLCMQSQKRHHLGPKDAPSQVVKTVRKDLQKRGLKALVSVTEELIDVSFQHLVRELRERIVEMKERAQNDESNALATAQRSFLSIVGSVVGYKREARGKTKKIEGNASKSTPVHQNSMQTLLDADFKVVEKEWKDVEAAIELESFQLIFSVLVEACDKMKESGKDDVKVRTVEMATSAILQMMKMLQGMAAVVSDDDETKEDENAMTPREISLNILEQLFERESFLNAPADLAKHFSTKMFSFEHLNNIVEVAHTFTTILLDEGEFKSLKVAKRKRKSKAKTIDDASDEEKEATGTADGAPSAPENVTSDGVSKVQVVEDAEDDDIPLSAMNPSLSVAGGTETETKENDKPPGAQPDGEVPGTSPTDGATDTVGNIADKGKTDDETSAAAGPETEEDERTKRIKSMLEADEKQRADDAPPEPSPSKVKMMLLADQEAAEKGAPKPTYVLDKDEAIRKGMARETEGETFGLDLDAEDPGEVEVRQVESIGIVRRFAHHKALESLLIPIRTALCRATELSGGKVYPIPEGALVSASATVVAKSAKVFSSVWAVAKGRERGALCGQFFNFGTLHVLNLALLAKQQVAVKPESVLGYLGDIGQDVGNMFMMWLSANPGLMYDMFFPMDKAAGKAYASLSLPLVRQQERLRESEGGRVEMKTFESGSEYSDGESDIEAIAQEMDKAKEAEKTASARKQRSLPRRTRKRKMRMVEHEDDEDVDVDEVQIGERERPSRGGEDDEDVDVDDLKLSKRRGVKKARLKLFDSDDDFGADSSEAEPEVKSKRDEAKSARKKVFESDDEYSDSELQNEAAPEKKREEPEGEGDEDVDVDELDFGGGGGAGRDAAEV